MNKQTMKAIKFGLALAAFFSAAQARAEIAIAMGVEGYVPGAYSRAAEIRAAQLENLSAAAEKLSAAEGADGGEVLLAGLYSGSVAAEKPAPVQLGSIKFSQPAQKEIRAPRSVKSAVEEIGADAPAAAPADSVEAEDADSGPVESPSTASASDAGGEEDDGKPTLGSMLLSTAIVIALAFFLVLVLL